MDNHSDIKKLSEKSEKEADSKENQEDSFFSQEAVDTGKNQALKIRCESAVTSTGLHKHGFLTKAEITKQEWYRFSWGLQPFPKYLRIRLCDLFGKPFRDLFLGVEDERRN